MSLLPKQIRYIVGNEACERFSFYGLKSVLVVYMTSTLLLTESVSISLLHLFVALVYLTPLLGAWLADKWLGRYNTILYISLLYCLGHGILSTADLFTDIESRRWVLYAGLTVIGLGAGGIKPCVSAFMGDQITDHSPKTMTRAYNLFYWSINLGSLFSFIVVPSVRDSYGWSWAFAVPGILMALATFIFWLGRRQYHFIPPSGAHQKQVSLWRIIFTAIFKGGWDKAKTLFAPERVRDAKAIASILSIFAFVIPFWSLFEQTASSWIIQGQSMTPIVCKLPFVGHWVLGPEQIQSANPAIVMILVPLITLLIYPYIGKYARPLFRIGAGIFLAALSFCIVAWLQNRLTNGESLSIAWQLIPYFILTTAEILVSTTGLEFAYTQAPKHIKSIITSFWNLTMFMGNILVAGITWLIADSSSHSVTTQSFLIYATLALVVGIGFVFAAKRYKNPLALS
ncbi:MAG: MFS transporter [Akkermansia sp.]